MNAQARPRSRRRVRLAVLLAAALAVAGCGASDEEPAAVGAETTAPSESTADSAVETGDEADADADPEEAEDLQEPEEPEEIVLTDSYRGVTAETITLGYTSIDFDELNDLFGLDLAFENSPQIADAIAAMWNERGGVLGRNIEFVHAPYLPTGPTSADEACTRLGEDEEVFAVLGGFAGPGAVEVNSCFNELYDTILVGGTPRTDQSAAAEGLWITAAMSDDRRNTALVSLLSQSGELETLGTTMVLGSAPEQLPLVDALSDELEAAGVEVAARDTLTTPGDRAATSASVEVWIEQARSSGITSVILLGDDRFRAEDFFANAPELTYVIGDGDSITDWLNTAPVGLSPGTRVITSHVGNDVDELTYAAMQECVDAVEEALGVEVVATSEVVEGDRDYFSGTTGACRTIGLFVQVATAAGADLTNDSFVAALDNVPDLILPGYEFASISGSKFDARDQLVLIEYDVETLTFNALTPPIDVG